MPIVFCFMLAWLGRLASGHLLSNLEEPQSQAVNNENKRLTLLMRVTLTKGSSLCP